MAEEEKKPEPKGQGPNLRELALLANPVTGPAKAVGYAQEAVGLPSQLEGAGEALLNAGSLGVYPAYKAYKRVRESQEAGVNFENIAKSLAEGRVVGPLYEPVEKPGEPAEKFVEDGFWSKPYAVKRVDPDEARKKYKKTRGKGMGSAGSFGYLSADLRPLAGGKFFPRGWEEKMARALKTGKIDKNKYDQAIGQYNKWLDTGLGAGVQASRMGTDLGLAQKDSDIDAQGILATGEEEAAQAQLKLHRDLTQDSEEYAQFERDATMELRRSMQSMEEARKNLSEMKMDIMGGTGQRIAAGIAIALGSIGQGLSKGNVNVGLQTVKMGIDRRAKELEMEYRKNMGSVEASQSAFGMAMRAVNSERQARQLIRTQLMDNTRQYVESRMQAAQSQSTKKSLQFVKESLDEQAALEEQQLKASVLGQIEGNMRARMVGRAKKNRGREALLQAAAQGKRVIKGPYKGLQPITVHSGFGGARTQQRLLVPPDMRKSTMEMMAASKNMRASLLEMQQLAQEHQGEMHVPGSLQGARWEGLAKGVMAQQKELMNLGAALTESEKEFLQGIDFRNAASLNPFGDGAQFLANKVHLSERIQQSLRDLDQAENHRVQLLHQVGKAGYQTEVVNDDGYAEVVTVIETAPGADQVYDQGASVAAQGEMYGGEVQATPR